MTIGKVYLVGAGPGDPDLLTIKAARILARSDVVLYDRLVSDVVLALINPGAEKIYVGKHEGQQEATQQEIFTLLVRHARSGKVVTRLKSGDPTIFGRAAEEWALMLSNGIPVEVVPGVPSAIAGAELAGVPLTARDLSHGFAVITGHDVPDLMAHLERYAKAETLVILMGIKQRNTIAEALIKLGRPAHEPAMFVERATTDRERVVTATLGEIAEGSVSVKPPAIFVTGAVVGLRQTLKPVSPLGSR
jgi:uroporphyrin-III C-methyltransferase